MWSKRFGDLSPDLRLSLTGLNQIVLAYKSVVKLDGSGNVLWKRELNDSVRAAGGPDGEVIVAACGEKLDVGSGPLCPANAFGGCYAVVKLAP